MYVSKIVYIQGKQLDRLKETLDNLDFSYVEKVESEMDLEVWVPFSDKLVKNLVTYGFLSNQEELELAKVEQLIGITEILFYA